MATEAKNTNYWISSTALYIQLNSMGEPDYIQCSVVSGASVLCYMSDVPGLGYDAGHNYQRWTLAAYPSIFPDSKRKYVYIAIPRQSTTDNNQATVVFPGQKIDIYGKTIPSSGTEGVQIGNEAYYYIFTGGIISAVKTDADNTRKREWEQHFDCGKLATDEAIASGGEGAWWRYNSVSDTITFLKEILKANFNELSANVARVTSLFLGGHKLKGVADSNGTLETSDDTVVTPHYLGQFGVKHFLAKDKDDTAHGTITWEKVQKFFSGLLIGNSNNENGGSWTTDAEGRSHLITDYLEVRMKAIFEELVINKTSTIGGKEIISPAGGVVAHKIEEVTVTYNNLSQKAYRCYFLAEQEGDSVDNDFAVNDQVRSESFNVRKGTYHKAGNHFYWRLAIGRDEEPVELEGKKYHYIDLSDTDCATASDVPAKGDVLSQCGNRTDVERQNCLIFSAVDTYSPSISLYHGINSYSFANREYVEYGVNKQTNKAFFNVYGDMYVGDRPTKENGYEGSSYIRYDSSTKQLSVKGKISAKSTVDGKELSQYIKENTDDTVANEAKKAAEDAQKAAQNAQKDITILGETVTGNKKEFDNYVTNGYLEPSEIAAMAQDSKRLEDAFAAAEKSYNEVKGAEVLKSTKELTDLNTAFTTLSTAKTELVTYLSDISTNYNKADTTGKATIVSAVGTKFTNFQSAYSAFYDKLGLANAYITSKIYGDLKQNITDLAGYKYLKDALGQTTYVDGGLVMTTILALRDGDGNVQSGINGAIDPNRGKKSIATWWGGQMVDKDYNSGNLTPATSLIRFDGSGYLANGAIWWDVSGKVHADPTSFIISEKNLGAYLTFFEPTWKEGSAGTSVADLVSLKPNAPFSKLGVSGDATFEGAISFHGIKLTYDSTNKAIKIDGNLYTTGGITAYGAGASTTGGGGLIASVISYARILEGSYTDADLTSIPNAYAIKALSSRIDNIATELGGLNLSWNNITGKPSTFTPSAHTHKWADITDRITKVSQLTNDAGYLTTHQSLASYYTKSSVDSLLSGKSATSHTHSVKINGVTKTIAATGGAAVDLGTYLTSHQSLADYAKKSEIPTKVSQLTNDTGYITSSGSCAYATNADKVDGVHVTWAGELTSTNHLVAWEADGSALRDIKPANVSVGNSDKLDGIHANGLLTALSNSDKGISITVGGTTKSVSNISVNYASSAGNADTVDGEHASAFTRIVGRYAIYTSGTAPYNYIHLFRIACSSGYSTIDCEIDFRTRYHSAKIEIRISTAEHPYNNGGSSISIIKKVVSGRTCDFWFLPTVQSSNYNYYDVYYKSGGWNSGSYGIISKGSNGTLVFEHKGTNLTSLPDKVTPVSNNVATSATKLQTPRTIWGQSFDGTGNVDGTLSEVGNIHFKVDNSYDIGSNDAASRYIYTHWLGARSGQKLELGANNSGFGQGLCLDTNLNVGIGTNSPAYKLHVVGDIYSTASIRTIFKDKAIILSDSDDPAWISALAGQIIFDTGKAIRFGETDWNWNKWAGLKYTHSNKTIYLGIADGSAFTALSPQNDGTLKFPGITTITPDPAARIGGSGGDLYLGNGNNTNWVKVQDMCSQVDSNNWKIMQGGYALFKDITIINTATINGSTHINNLLTAKGIMPTTTDVNAFGTNVNNWDGSIAANVTNMFNGIPQDNIQVEYSMDNGATWNTYFGNPENRFNLINDNARGFNYYLGSNNLLGDTEADKLAQIKKNQLRVTVKIPDEIYQELSWISVDVNNGVDIKCQVYFGSSTGGYKEYVSKIMKGWAHKCDICVGPLNVNVGNDNYRYVRLVFSHLNTHTALRNGIVDKIRALALTKYKYYGDRYTISTTGHIYDYDAYMNTYFPNSILAKGGVTAYQSSDIRLKQDLRKLDYLGIIKAMGGTYGFAWKKDNTRSIGWIAQHVLCNPHLKDIVETDEKGYYKINYWSPKLIATAFGAIEQVGDEVSRLKARVVFLESEVQRLSGDKEDCNKKRLDNKNINSLN